MSRFVTSLVSLVLFPSVLHAASDIFSYEPTIAEVREAAIRYAEVQPEKILQWRRQASWRALLPHVDLGIDRSRSFDTHFDEGTFPHFQVVETQEGNTGIDISMTWKLGELLWNDDQTSIDVRSKFMVELRNNIVKEVTRAYFERRRLQLKQRAEPTRDPTTQPEQDLRIEELTALLDGWTGGYFSQHTTIMESP